MDKREIIESYKKVRKAVDWMVTLLPWVLFLFSGVIIALCLCFLVPPGVFGDMILLSLMPVGFGAFFLGSKLCNTIEEEVWLRYYEEWGMTVAEIEAMEAKMVSEASSLNRSNLSAQERAEKRAFLQTDDMTHTLPLFQRICKLNPSAWKTQQEFLVERYSEEVISYVFRIEYSDAKIETCCQYWRIRETTECLAMLELLFKLTVLEDGIHNDEWNLLMQMMNRLGLGNDHVEYFKKRYAALRTEFGEDEEWSGASKSGQTGSSLRSYYTVLGLQEGASDEEIKRAYHKLALQHHPDLPKNADRIKECEVMMARVNEAYEKVIR